MTATTHVAVSCLITVTTTQSGMNSWQQAMVVAVTSLLAHFILDLIPHGFLATPSTIFKKVIPTVTELLPGLLILLTAISLFDSPLLFLIASGCGVIPDILTTLFYKNKRLIIHVPPFLAIHQLHRKVHWFEIEHEDGTVSYRFSNFPLISLEAVFTLFLLIKLFK